MYKNLLVFPKPVAVRVNALDSYLITSIYPVREGLAIMVTNSFGGIQADVWFVLERHMRLSGDVVRTRLCHIGQDIHLDAALHIASKYGLAVYGRDPIGDDLPF